MTISSTPRAMIVEDDHSWQEILTELLSDLGLVVDVAGSLAEALPVIRSYSHRLAVVDLSLDPSDYDNQDGLQALDAIRSTDPGCMVIMLTGFATVELAVNVLTQHGAFSCLRKEVFSRGQLRELAGRALTSAPLQSVPSSSHSSLSQPKSTLAAAAPKLEKTKGLVLIAEDDAGWRSLLTDLFGEAGYQTRPCSSFGEALGRLRREKFVLAMVDLSLTPSPIFPAPVSATQQLDGYRLLDILRTARIPALVLSGISSPLDIEQTYLEYGIFAYLQKQTFDRHTLLQMVEEALAAQVPSSDEQDKLTEREWEVLEYLAQGKTNKEIAEAMVITTNTVKQHLKSVFEKLDIHTRAAAAAHLAGKRIEKH